MNRSHLDICLLCLALAGCAAPTPPPPPKPVTAKPPPAAAAAAKQPAPDELFKQFKAYARNDVADNWTKSKDKPQAENQPFQNFAEQRGGEVSEEFFKGRYNRSRARLPKNVEKWRSEPDIDNPGADLANFPNSAFTLPQGRAYIEFSPFTYYGTASSSPAQYNSEFLLRYGVTDDIELRLFGNGVSWLGGSKPTWGFSPIAFDTKIQLWTEKPDYFLPAAGFEAYIQTEWLGNQAFNGGTQPSFSFNFDQSLPWGIDLEYNLGVTRFQDSVGQNIWEFSFQWGLQRDLFNDDFAVFIHGFFNAASLPRVPNLQLAYNAYQSPSQIAVGGGFLWSVSKRLALYGQVSGGATAYTPCIISYAGLAFAF